MRSHLALLQWGHFIRHSPHIYLDYKVELATAAALIAKTRTDAGTLNKEIDKLCRRWTGLSTEEVSELAKKAVPMVLLKEIDGFFGRFGRLKK